MNSKEAKEQLLALKATHKIQLTQMRTIQKAKETEMEQLVRALREQEPKKLREVDPNAPPKKRIGATYSVSYFEVGESLAYGRNSGLLYWVLEKTPDRMVFAYRDRDQNIIEQIVPTNDITRADYYYKGKVNKRGQRR